MMFTITVLVLSGFGGSTEAPLDSGVSTVPDSTVSESAPLSEPDPAPVMSWGDYDGDGFPDLYAIYPSGEDRMFRNVGDGSFTDVTVVAGLAGNVGSRSAQWADYDRDGFLDLYVAADRAERRLFRNRGTGAFDDMTRAVGLEALGAELAAAWVDYDGDTYPDLAIRTSTGDHLLHNTSEGWFERVQLGLPVALPSELGHTKREGGEEGRESEGDGSNMPPPIADEDKQRTESDLDARPEPAARLAPHVPSPWTPGPIANIPGLPLGSGLNPPTPACLPTIRDRVPPYLCIQASSIPTLDMLYPITQNLFVSIAGNVGMGTTSPAAKLHVEGTGLMKGTLTLNPTLGDLDKAVDISTGNIYKDGALFIHTKGSPANTAIGREALANVMTSGQRNTASGSQALYFNSTGTDNTANGHKALYYNTTGFGNTASGAFALRSNIEGRNNTSTGFRALFSNTTGDTNTATGWEALFHNTEGIRNTASGVRALYYNETGDNNTASGQSALLSNSTGSFNTASGFQALEVNTTGDHNTATGYSALHNNETGNRNIASGDQALRRSTTGNGNIALGFQAGYNLTTGDDNIAIGHLGVAGEGATVRLGTSGTHTRAFIAGIRGVTTDMANAIPVLVDSLGQLGTVSSSRRFKKDIADMGDLTERLLELRPVAFRYKQEQNLPDGSEVPLEYGLIAEEVAEVFPDLVVYDEEGEPFTVKYHLLSAMLLNELKKQAHELGELHEGLETQSAAHARELDELRSEFEARFAAIESRTSPATLPAAVPAGGQ